MALNIVGRLAAGKWVAGPELDDALDAVRKLNSRGASAIINYLGEALSDKSLVEKSVEEELEIIRRIKEEKLAADISVKPTQIGLSVSKTLFSKNYARIVDFAKRNGVFVWFDMEEYKFIDATIDVYKEQIRKGNVGICIQSYLKRSLADVKELSKHRAVIRLVKGAYTDHVHGVGDREKTTENYIAIMDYMFKHCKRFTIGTHDPRMTEKALKLNKEYKRAVTYAVLRGIRNNYAFALAKSGENVSIYVPFGERWLEYSYRRLKELSNLKLIVRSMFGG